METPSPYRVTLHPVTPHPVTPHLPGLEPPEYNYTVAPPSAPEAAPEDISAQRAFECLMGVRPMTERTIRGPMRYAGSKHRCAEWVISHLPQMHTYVEVFGGSGIIMLNKKPSVLEVFNDRHTGFCDLFRAIRDYPKELTERLDWTLYSREQFEEAYHTALTIDDTRMACWERAARLITLHQFSYAGHGNVWEPAAGGRDTPTTNFLKRIPVVEELHRRLRGVVIENLDWSELMPMYDGVGVCFYCDPPYVDTLQPMYAYRMHADAHKDFLDRVFQLKGFVAVSGYPNDLYSKYPWDRVIAANRHNTYEHGKNAVIEMLFIKNTAK